MHVRHFVDQQAVTARTCPHKNNEAVEAQRIVQRLKTQHGAQVDDGHNLAAQLGEQGAASARQAAGAVLVRRNRLHHRLLRQRETLPGATHHEGWRNGQR